MMMLKTQPLLLQLPQELTIKGEIMLNSKNSDKLDLAKDQILWYCFKLSANLCGVSVSAACPLYK